MNNNLTDEQKHQVSELCGALMNDAFVEKLADSLERAAVAFVRTSRVAKMELEIVMQKAPIYTPGATLGANVNVNFRVSTAEPEPPANRN